jgi:Zn-dependent protease/CBS domain-containing protein
VLALRVYPDFFPEGSEHRDNVPLHFAMAAVSGLAFFASVVLHELAHSIVARKQGVGVKGITLFIFGGVAQITGDSPRPLYEFIMAVVGPLTSLAIGGICFLAWWLVGDFNSEQPGFVVLQWLLMMNLVVGVFNLAPGFPMDGGRILRSALWGISGNFHSATRIATLGGRGLGLFLIGLGPVASIVGILGLSSFLDPWSGLWFFLLGLFLEQSARQSWAQTRALQALSQATATQLMSQDLHTVRPFQRLRDIREVGARPRRPFLYFVSDADNGVMGVLTESRVARVRAEQRADATVGEVMQAVDQTPVAAASDDGARMLQAMEAADVWHLPVVDDGRVIGVVSKDSLLRLIGEVLRPKRPLPRRA